MKKSVREAKPERLMRWSSFCGWFCFLCVWIFRKRYGVLGMLLIGILIVKEVVFRCCNGAIARVLLEVWLGFPLLS